jgi:BirA family biotin operon repressor/biotin-[acetyl-CoA-carboxylase] ligase
MSISAAMRHTRFEDFDITCFDTVVSTNLLAAELAKKGAPDGKVVVAARQTGGRGRGRREWKSTGNGLWFSLVLRPAIEPQYAAQATLLTAVAAAKTLRLITGEEFTIKWPNDVMLRGRKICGILAQLELDKDGGVEYAVVGVGINVNMTAADFGEEISKTATSLLLATGRRHSRKRLLQAFLPEFKRLYLEWAENGFSRVRAQWIAYNCTLGRAVVIKDDGREIFAGRAEAIDNCGNLLVTNDSGRTETFNFGEVSVRS